MKNKFPYFIHSSALLSMKNIMSGSQWVLSKGNFENYINDPWAETGKKKKNLTIMS